MIAENFEKKLDIQSIVLACLFHDMGNIIKSDLDRFPQFLEPEGRQYWQTIKDDFLKKYGGNENAATHAMAKEIGLPREAMDCLSRIGFSHATENEIASSYEGKICNYADMRVGPHGVLPMEERIAEARKRYEGRKHSISSNDFDSRAGSLRSIEKQIFEKTAARPEDITDNAIESIITELKSLSV